MMDRGTTEVAGVVLAGGRSSRMGRSKALLQVDGQSFLSACVWALRDGGCEAVVAVVPPGADAEREEAERAGARAVEGAGPESEQIDSLRIGLDALGSESPVVVLPVDHPLVRPATVRALIDAANEAPGSVIRPTRRNEPGHPTLFPPSAWPALRDPSLDRGARSVVDAFPVVDVPVGDPGVLADIDTPGAYRRHVEESP
jgi:molybdenum cofactor cytidylyltransferase